MQLGEDVNRPDVPRAHLRHQPHKGRFQPFVRQPPEAKPAKQVEPWTADNGQPPQRPADLATEAVQLEKRIKAASTNATLQKLGDEVNRIAVLDAQGRAYFRAMLVRRIKEVLEATAKKQKEKKPKAEGKEPDSAEGQGPSPDAKEP